jgi:hypothetical protein
MTKMLLCIDDPGYFINIPRISSFRTPIKKDVTITDLNLIIIELKKLGIENYTIKSISEVKNKKPKKQEEIKIDKSIKEKSVNEVDINKRFNDLEKLLNNIISNSINPNQVQIIKEKIDKQKNDDAFIPSVDLDDVKISGKSTFKTKKIINNTDENSESLAKLLRK